MLDRFGRWMGALCGAGGTTGCAEQRCPGRSISRYWTTASSARSIGGVVALWSRRGPYLIPGLSEVAGTLPLLGFISVRVMLVHSSQNAVPSKLQWFAIKGQPSS